MGRPGENVTLAPLLLGAEPTHRDKRNNRSDKSHESSTSSKLHSGLLGLMSDGLQRYGRLERLGVDAGSAVPDKEQPNGCFEKRGSDSNAIDVM